MIKNGKEYRDFVTDDKKYQPVFNFIESFEKNNTISIRVRDADYEKVEEFVATDPDFTDEKFDYAMLPFDMFEINTNNYRIYVRRAETPIPITDNHKNTSDYAFDMAYVTKNRKRVELAVSSFGFNMGLLLCRREDLDQASAYRIMVKKIIYYITHQRKSVVYIDDKEKSKENKSDSIKNKDLPKVHYITIDDAVVYTRKGVGTGRKIQAECYGVRGHYRHYKSGLTVFIKPYKKGWNRNGQVPAKQQYTL